MTDPFFSPSAIPRPLLEIAACTGAEFAGGPGLQVIINGAAEFGGPGRGESPFLECPGQVGALQGQRRRHVSSQESKPPCCRIPRLLWSCQTHTPLSCALCRKIGRASCRERV